MSSCCGGSKYVNGIWCEARDSILNRSQCFHVVDGLDIDVMHDQLEGVLPLQLKMLLTKYVIIDKLFMLWIVNDRIASFDYGPTDVKNKPSILKDHILSSDSESIQARIQTDANASVKLFKKRLKNPQQIQKRLISRL